jgi:eukaryotic-like serine/threonine-protein kinase
MKIDSQNWEQLQALFHLAADTPEEARAQVLAETCPDPELRERAMALVMAANAETEPPPDAGSQSVRRGDLNGWIGPYHLVRHLGTGGIGSVYLAERIVGGAPRLSALKVLARHAAGPQFVERFHREQHILASLEHPNITRMLDAGLSEGEQPYLVMEYVNGTHLDVHCETHGLSVEQRLQLFLQVCDAVAYAHRNLIVHLDLKPSNILVTEEGVVKLLDFGTSKLIEPDSLLTTTVMATPAYASPEQLRNEPVTTACDIYSLGAILFELLSGRRPGGKASVAIMIERAMNESDPEKLSKAVSAEAAHHSGVSEERLRQVLRGDLETITEKCLQPRVKDRYASVDALSQDVQNYLENRPVAARPRTLVYRVRKFVRRNRKGVAIAALASLLLATSIGFGGWRQHQAVLAGERAIRMQTMMFSLFSIARWQYSGKPNMSVNDFLNLGVRTLPLYIHDREDLRAAQLSLAESLHRNGDYADAQIVFAEVAKSAHDDHDANAETQALAFEGDIAAYRGQMGNAAAFAAESLALSRKSKVTPLAHVLAERYYAIYHEVYGPPSDEDLPLLNDAVRIAKTGNLPPTEVAATILDLARATRARGRFVDAEAYYQQALNLYKQDPAFICDAAKPEGELGRAQLLRGKLEDALAHNQHAYQVITQCAGTENSDARFLGRYVAQDLLWLGRASEALPIMQRIVQSERKQDGGAGGPNLANYLYVLAWAELSTGNAVEAEKLLKEEMTLAKGKVDPFSRGYGPIPLMYAQVMAAEHRDREALTYDELAIRALGPSQSNEGYQDTMHVAQAHKLFVQLQTRLAAESSSSAPK